MLSGATTATTVELLDIGDGDANERNGTATMECAGASIASGLPALVGTEVRGDSSR